MRHPIDFDGIKAVALRSAVSKPQGGRPKVALRDQSQGASMNPYLTKLRGLSEENLQVIAPSKPSKPCFDGFEGEQSSRVSGNEPVEFEQGYYGNALAALRSKRPELVESDRWQQAIHDASSFLATWGAQAEAFGWTERELFGLPDVPDRPRPKYQRLSRYDQTGLVWLLQGRRVVELTKDKAVIETATGTVSFYRPRRDGPRANRGHHSRNG
jgi:hypothetical protein